jgi:hypothetical protein
MVISEFDTVNFNLMVNLFHGVLGDHGLSIGEFGGCFLREGGDCLVIVPGKFMKCAVCSLQTCI